MPKPITVYEHSRLYIGEQEFNAEQFNAMVKYNDLHGGKYFQVGYNKIIFKQYVGVIQVGNRVIEILPKVESKRESTSTKKKWQDALLYMLSKAGYIKLNQTENASQHTGNINLMDIYLYSFLKEVDQLIHAGLVKKYRLVQANRTSLKGRLLIEKQIQHNIVHKERFFTEHTVYDRDNVFNSILKAALEIVHHSTTNGSIKQEAAKHLLYFDGISSWVGIAADFDKLKLDRKTRPYKLAIELARMIIFNYCPDMKSGTKHVLALLFDMNLLFEKFIYRMLKQEEDHFADIKLSVKKQTSEQFWQHKTIRPDIVITFNNGSGEQKIIVDTKWKAVDAGYPSDSDLKQMFAYNIQFDSAHSVLLYPYINQKNHGKGAYSPGYRKPGITHSCEMYFIDLFEGEVMSKTFSHNFISYLTESNKHNSNLN